MKTIAENVSKTGEFVRSPIVVVMGHVDHGKTTLLDYIRKTNMAAKEAGGITQSIGAYEITHNSKLITFVDTPGHEAFSKMRARGVKAADLAILVVAADDGVKPQTKEAIALLKETKTPFIVAINKIDKNNADIERVKNDLLKNDVLLEGYGGSVSFQLISAKNGEGVSELLDLLVLATEMENLFYAKAVPASGFVIESKLDRRKGNEVMVIVKNGILRRGDEIYTATASGKIKILENFLGETVEELHPSSPALIIGFETLPLVGEEFLVASRPTKEAGMDLDSTTKKQEESGGTVLRLILKSDVQGSLEALAGMVKNILIEEVGINIMDARVGDVTDGDVKSAIANRAVILGFKVRVERAAANLAQANKVKIIEGDVIYDLVDKVKAELKELKSPQPEGELEILAVFGQKTVKQLVGGRVARGLVKIRGSYDVKRGEEILGSGKIISLESDKKETSQVESGKECGMIFESSVKIAIGDCLVARK